MKGPPKTALSSPEPPHMVVSLHLGLGFRGTNIDPKILYSIFGGTHQKVALSREYRNMISI